MPRLKMPGYPTDEGSPWHLVIVRIPRWAVNVAQQRARYLQVETWVVLCDWLQRANRLPTPPTVPPAVYRRYPGIYLPSGHLASEDPAQLELAAARETQGAVQRAETLFRQDAVLEPQLEVTPTKKMTSRVRLKSVPTKKTSRKAGGKR